MMTNSEKLTEKFACLRRQAEERIKQWPRGAFLAPADSHKLIYELKIHLAELEIQNEDLRRELQQVAARQEEEVDLDESVPLDNNTVRFLKDYHRVIAHREEVSKRGEEGEKW